MLILFLGVGGQVDFIRGAALGLDGQGKPILAMPSVMSRGESKIVSFIKKGNDTDVLINPHVFAISEIFTCKFSAILSCC